MGTQKPIRFRATLPRDSVDPVGADYPVLRRTADRLARLRALGYATDG